MKRETGRRARRRLGRCEFFGIESSPADAPCNGSDAVAVVASPMGLTRDSVCPVFSELEACEIGLNPAGYGTHTLRRTKAALIYRRTKNLGAVQLFLGQSKLKSTVRYFRIEVDDALEMAEQPEA